MISPEQELQTTSLEYLRNEFSLGAQELKDFRKLPRKEQERQKDERLAELTALSNKLDKAMQEAINTGDLEVANQLKNQLEKEILDLEQQFQVSEVLPTTEKERANAAKIAEIYDKCFAVNKQTGEKAFLDPILSEEDLRFIYGIDFKITGIINRKDSSPLNQILDTRKDKRFDLTTIYDCRPEQISFTDEELEKGDIILHYGNLNIFQARTIEGLKLPKNISGDLNLSGLQLANGLVLPETISGDLHLRSLKSAKGLKLPKHVGRNLVLYGLTTAKDLILPDVIGGHLYLGGLNSIEDLILPDIIGGTINLGSHLPKTEIDQFFKKYPNYKDKLR